MKKTKLTRSLLAACSIVALSAVMYGCTHSGDDPVVMEDPSEPTPYETAMTEIAAADTAEAAQAAYDEVDQTAITGEEAQSLQMALASRLETLATAAREEAQKMDLADAADMIDTSDLSTAQAIADATTAINALKAAIAAAVDVDDTSMYQTMVDNAETAVMTAQGHLDTQGRMMAQRMAISNAVTMARTAVAGVDDDSTDSEVAAADSAITALEAAIEGAADLPADDPDVASARGTLATLKGTLSVAKDSRDDALEDADKAAAEAAAKLGKAMHAALGGPTAAGNALDNIGRDTPANFGLQANGTLRIDAAANAGSFAPVGGTDTDPDPVTLEAGASPGALGSWNGTDYMHMEGTGDDKVVNEARVYNNKGPGKREAFADALPSGVTIAEANVGGAVPAQISDLTTAIKGYIAVNSGTTFTTELDIDKVMAAAFTHSGTQTHAIPEQRNSVSFRGTYDDAPGEYRCVTGCSSTNDGTGSPSGLGGTWFFKPDAGAMVQQPDAHYLYYGWWVSKDNDGMPTAASAFVGRFGTAGDDSATDDDGLNAGWSGTYTAGTTLTGSARYEGNAAGKYAIDNVLDGTGHGGHFTADAELTATFSAADADDVGITGTIDNFRLNDGSDDPGWSVSLHQTGFGSGGAIDATTATATNANDNNADGTTWSFGDNAAPESGAWSGMMYDEAVTGDDDDGSNIPTTVTGTFYSEFSTIGRMVGAFGADKQ